MFDLEHRAERAWLDKWGKAPESLADQIAHARRLYAAAPKLVPIFGHRYISSSPEESGNPVFSVHQMDIIQYGVDLEDYLHVEFLGRRHASSSPGRTPRRIPFWSDIIDFNDAGGHAGSDVEP